MGDNMQWHDVDRIGFMGIMGEWGDSTSGKWNERRRVQCQCTVHNNDNSKQVMSWQHEEGLWPLPGRFSTTYTSSIRP